MVYVDVFGKACPDQGFFCSSREAHQVLVPVELGMEHLPGEVIQETDQTGPQTGVFPGGIPQIGAIFALLRCSDGGGIGVGLAVVCG